MADKSEGIRRRAPLCSRLWDWRSYEEMEQKVGRGGDRWRRWRGEEKEKVEAVAVKVQDIWVKGHVPEKTVRACIQEEVSKQEVRCLSGSRRQEMRSADCSH